MTRKESFLKDIDKQLSNVQGIAESIRISYRVLIYDDEMLGLLYDEYREAIISRGENVFKRNLELQYNFETFINNNFDDNLEHAKSIEILNKLKPKNKEAKDYRITNVNLHVEVEDK